MRFVRSAGPADLDVVLELAGLSGPGFTSLPVDEAALSERLMLSAHSFAGEVAPAEAWYTLLLEDSETGRVDGIAGVRAAIGLQRPHFSFRVVTLAQYSASIGKRFDHQALVLVNECAGWTEVGSLFLRAEARASGAGRLLARARYMLIGAEPALFSETVMAELRGWIDPEGRCPFWDGVASKFFRLPFVEADRMIVAGDGQFILDLAPRHPIYVELIDDAARQGIGRCHRQGEAALAMLEREGFARHGLIDLFDGGPTVSCARDHIATIANARSARVRIGDPGSEAEPCLVSRDTITGFRAIRAPASLRHDEMLVAAESADALQVRECDLIRIAQ